MLTDQQMATLKADIEADPVLDAYPQNTDGAFEIAAAYNLVAVPDFFVWKNSVTVNDLMGGDGFEWTRVDNLTDGKARIWEWMTHVGIVNPSVANVRAGFNACFATAGDAGVRAAIYSRSQRLASRVEKLFATGTGTASDDTGSGPAVMSFVGAISYHDVQEARES